MLIFASTQSCRNNHINKSKLVSRNLIRKFLVASCLAIFPLSSIAIEIETPAVGLTGVPLDYSVSGLSEGADAQLTVAGATWSATADADGTAMFDGVLIEEAGTAVVTVSAEGQTAVPTFE